MAGSVADEVSFGFRQQLEKHPQFRGRGRLVCSEFHDGVLRLSGCLPSFYLKQLVQALAHRIPGVSRVVNRIDVRDALTGDGELETWRVG
jgi:osmotically-inducible protein OsmY